MFRPYMFRATILVFVAKNKFYYSLSFLWLIISLLFYTGPYIYSISSAFSVYKPDCFIVILQFVIEQKPYIFFHPILSSFSVSPKLMDTRFCKTRAQHISWGRVHPYPHSPTFSSAATLRHAPSHRHSGPLFSSVPPTTHTFLTVPSEQHIVFIFHKDKSMDSMEPKINSPLQGIFIYIIHLTTGTNKRRNTINDYKSTVIASECCISILAWLILIPRFYI
jgi:hypothetical protein